MGFRHQETRDWLGGRLQAVMEVSKSTPVLIQRGNYTSPLIDHVRGVVVTNAVLIGRQWQRSSGPKYQTQRSHEPIAPLPSVKLADSVRAPGFTGKLFLFPPFWWTCETGQYHRESRRRAPPLRIFLILSFHLSRFQLLTHPRQVPFDMSINMTAL